MSYINKEIQEKILKITALINQKFPELSKFLEEIPTTIPNEEHPHLNNEVFEDYYESLLRILQKYAQEHNIALDVI